MKRLLLLAALCGIAAVSVGAEPPAGDDPWLSLVGHWVLEGRIAGKDTTHDVDGEWVLNHLYVRLHEVSREKDAGGQAAYEAIVYVTQDLAPGEYAVLWLDNTASGAFAAEGIGHAKPEGESLPFVFKDAHGKVSFKNTFAYDPASSHLVVGHGQHGQGHPEAVRSRQAEPALIGSPRRRYGTRVGEQPEPS